ncbi:hypothetical protein [Sorangium sp. So ce1000]|uniref:hypothetical protein n=1 Tax=Sorangium sp. So ce1000 TaxID=3133325 RepID=UPI003F5E54EE
MPTTRLLRSAEIPQADNLANVRRVLDALSGGAIAKEQIAEQTGISLRHVGYALAAARVLGWLGDDGTAITPAGRELLATPPGSGDERAHLRRAIFACGVVREVAPDLFEPAAPTRVALARRIFRFTAGIGKETAARRAQTLLAWRSQVLEQQLPLFPKRPRKRGAEAPVGAGGGTMPDGGEATAPGAAEGQAPGGEATAPGAAEGQAPGGEATAPGAAEERAPGGEATVPGAAEERAPGRRRRRRAG